MFQEAPPKGHKGHECHHMDEGKLLHYISDWKRKAKITAVITHGPLSHSKSMWNGENERDLILRDWFV